MKLKNIVSIILLGLLSGILGSFISTKLILKINENPNDKNLLESEYLKHKSTHFKTVSNLDEKPNTGYSDLTYPAEIGLPAVVHVKTSYNQPNYTLYDFIFGTTPRYSTPVQSSGSGVIISSDGYIVTNNHVIENAEIIEVVLSDKKSYSAKLVGLDATTDIALLKIDAKNLSSLKYGNSDDLKIGEWVLAIGNPFNLTSTATAGIVSAKARNNNIMKENMAIESFIQTDAAVNPGNSGGALLNTNGELVGINTAIASPTGSFVGYSFAIPVNIVRKVVADLVEYGEVQRGYLGIELLDIDANVAKKMNIVKLEGVLANKIWENGAANKAGIKAGDIILEINSIKINSSSELLEHTSQYRPGDEIILLINRNSTNKTVKLILQNKFGDTSIVKSKTVEFLGAKFEVLNDYDKQKLQLRNGIQIIELTAGKFAQNGIKKGFIIIKINDTFIKTVEDLENIIKNTKGNLFIEGIYPNGATAYYSFRI